MLPEIEKRLESMGSPPSPRPPPVSSSRSGSLPMPSSLPKRGASATFSSRKLLPLIVLFPLLARLSPVMTRVFRDEGMLCAGRTNPLPLLGAKPPSSEVIMASESSGSRGLSCRESTVPEDEGKSEKGLFLLARVEGGCVSAERFVIIEEQDMVVSIVRCW